MAWVHGEWTQCEVVDFQYIKSPEKGTPGFELTCQHHENGTIAGVWWLTDTINSKGVPMWQAAKDRCKQLGATEEGLNGDRWVEHARENVVGKTVACLVNVDQYGAKAQFIGIPKGSGGGMVKADTATPSLFAAKAKRKDADPFTDDDVPF